MTSVTSDLSGYLSRLGTGVQEACLAFISLRGPLFFWLVWSEPVLLTDKTSILAVTVNQGEGSTQQSWGCWGRRCCGMGLREQYQFKWQPGGSSYLVTGVACNWGVGITGDEGRARQWWRWGQGPAVVGESQSCGMDLGDLTCGMGQLGWLVGHSSLLLRPAPQLIVFKNRAQVSFL